MRNPIQDVTKSVVMLALLLLGACEFGGVRDLATTRDVTPGNATYAPKPDQALVVFMRPSFLFEGYDAAIFDVTDGALDFKASLAMESKLAYYVEPGKRKYMVVGYNADFMTTNLEAGKVYYVMVSPSYGLRFWFRSFNASGPFTPNKLDLNSPKFPGWYDKTRWVESVATPPNPKKVDEYMKRVRIFRDEWDPKWRARSDQPKLDPEDGRTTVYRGTSAN